MLYKDVLIIWLILLATFITTTEQKSIPTQRQNSKNLGRSLVAENALAAEQEKFHFFINNLPVSRQSAADLNENRKRRKFTSPQSTKNDSHNLYQLLDDYYNNAVAQELRMREIMEELVLRSRQTYEQNTEQPIVAQAETKYKEVPLPNEKPTKAGTFYRPNSRRENDTLQESQNMPVTQATAQARWPPLISYSSEPSLDIVQPPPRPLNLFNNAADAGAFLRDLPQEPAAMHSTPLNAQAQVINIKLKPLLLDTKQSTTTPPPLHLSPDSINQQLKFLQRNAEKIKNFSDVLERSKELIDDSKSVEMQSDIMSAVEENEDLPVASDSHGMEAQLGADVVSDIKKSEIETKPENLLPELAAQHNVTLESQATLGVGQNFNNSLPQLEPQLEPLDAENMKQVLLHVNQYTVYRILPTGTELRPNAVRHHVKEESGSTELSVTEAPATLEPETSTDHSYDMVPLISKNKLLATTGSTPRNVSENPTAMKLENSPEHTYDVVSTIMENHPAEMKENDQHLNDVIETTTIPNFAATTEYFTPDPTTTTAANLIYQKNEPGSEFIAATQTATTEHTVGSTDAATAAEMPDMSMLKFDKNQEPLETQLESERELDTKGEKSTLVVAAESSTEIPWIATVVPESRHNTPSADSAIIATESTTLSPESSILLADNTMQLPESTTILPVTTTILTETETLSQQLAESNANLVDISESGQKMSEMTTDFPEITTAAPESEKHMQESDLLETKKFESTTEMPKGTTIWENNRSSERITEKTESTTVLPENKDYSLNENIQFSESTTELPVITTKLAESTTAPIESTTVLPDIRQDSRKHLEAIIDHLREGNTLISGIEEILSEGRRELPEITTVEDATIVAETTTLSPEISTPLAEYTTQLTESTTPNPERAILTTTLLPESITYSPIFRAMLSESKALLVESTTDLPESTTHSTAESKAVVTESTTALPESTKIWPEYTTEALEGDMDLPKTSVPLSKSTRNLEENINDRPVTEESLHETSMSPTQNSPVEQRTEGTLSSANEPVPETANLDAIEIEIIGAATELPTIQKQLAYPPKNMAEFIQLRNMDHEIYAEDEDDEEDKEAKNISEADEDKVSNKLVTAEVAEVEQNVKPLKSTEDSAEKADASAEILEDDDEEVSSREAEMQNDSEEDMETLESNEEAESSWDDELHDGTEEENSETFESGEENDEQFLVVDDNNAGEAQSDDDDEDEMETLLPQIGANKMNLMSALRESASAATTEQNIDENGFNGQTEMPESLTSASITATTNATVPASTTTTNTMHHFIAAARQEVVQYEDITQQQNEAIKMDKELKLLNTRADDTRHNDEDEDGDGHDVHDVDADDDELKLLQSNKSTNMKSQHKHKLSTAAGDELPTIEPVDARAGDSKNNSASADTKWRTTASSIMPTIATTNTTRTRAANMATNVRQVMDMNEADNSEAYAKPVDVSDEQKGHVQQLQEENLALGSNESNDDGADKIDDDDEDDDVKLDDADEADNDDSMAATEMKVEHGNEGDDDGDVLGLVNAAQTVVVNANNNKANDDKQIEKNLLRQQQHDVRRRLLATQQEDASKPIERKETEINDNVGIGKHLDMPATQIRAIMQPTITNVRDNNLRRVVQLQDNQFQMKNVTAAEHSTMSMDVAPSPLTIHTHTQANNFAMRTIYETSRTANPTTATAPTTTNPIEYATTFAGKQNATNETEIETTNWWHTLPYAEIRKFLNTIFDSVNAVNGADGDKD